MRLFCQFSSNAPLNTQLKGEVLAKALKTLADSGYGRWETWFCGAPTPDFEALDPRFWRPTLDFVASTPHFYRHHPICCCPKFVASIIRGVYEKAQGVSLEYSFVFFWGWGWVGCEGGWSLSLGAQWKSNCKESLFDFSKSGKGPDFYLNSEVCKMTPSPTYFI